MRIELYWGSASPSGPFGRWDSLDLEAPGPEAWTVGDVLRWAEGHHGLRIGRWPEQGSRGMAGGVTVTVNSLDVECLDGLDTPLGPDDRVAIIGKSSSTREEDGALKRTAILRFYGPLATRFRLPAGGPYEVAVEEGLSFRGIIDRLSADFGPQVSGWLLDPATGEIRGHLGIAVNGRSLDRAQALDTVISPSDQVTAIEIIAGVAGG